MELADDRRDWEELGTLDAQWAILTEPDKRHGGWDDDEFFATGPRDIAPAIERMERFGLPERRGRALDFGCGFGRLTRALAAHFDEAVGVDISREMVAGATERNGAVPNVRFVANANADVRCFDDGEFDLVFSFIALQHVSSRDAIRSYLSDFVRVLAPGGLLAVHLPSDIAPRYRIQPRRHAYRVLRRARVPHALLYDRLGLHPMSMAFLPVPEVRAQLEAAGARILEVDSERWQGAYTSTFYYATPR